MRANPELRRMHEGTPMLRRNFAHIRNAVTAASLAYAPGHYYSPICNPTKIQTRYRSPHGCNEEVSLPGIDLQRSRQIERLLSWKRFLLDIDFPENHTPPRRYNYGRSNSLYALGDAICLYCFIRELNSKRYVEIGSGFSSACVLDTVDQLLLDLQCTFIDPEPERLQALLKSNEPRPFRLLPQMVQDVPIDIFDELDAGDILFIDSSHVLKTCSDVEYELFSILPRLKPGVFVHFHDIFYPFEYPPEWVIERNYSWNEIYGLRAFLMYNNKFRIEFWNDYLVKTSAKFLTDIAPNMIRHPGGSLWVSVTS
jgi:hypothetical protein